MADSHCIYLEGFMNSEVDPNSLSEKIRASTDLAFTNKNCMQIEHPESGTQHRKCMVRFLLGELFSLSGRPQNLVSLEEFNTMINDCGIIDWGYEVRIR